MLGWLLEEGREDASGGLAGAPAFPAFLPVQENDRHELLAIGLVSEVGRHFGHGILDVARELAAASRQLPDVPPAGLANIQNDWSVEDRCHVYCLPFCSCCRRRCYETARYLAF